MALLPSPARGKLQRVLLKTGRWSGPLGALGRWFGRQYGCPLSCGYRLIIENPMEYIQRYVIAHGVYEPFISGVFEAVLLPTDLYFDIGANIGNHALVAASRCGCVHAFEPVPRVAQRLRSNIRFNGLEGKITVVEAAAGSTPGTANINVMGRNDDGSHSMLLGERELVTDTISVPILTLDQYVRDAKLSMPQLVKIDVEGFEARVLDGAKTLLSASIPPLWIIETGDRMADQLGESASSVLGRFFALSYRVIQIPEITGTPREVFPGTVPGDLQNYLCVHPASPQTNHILSVLDVP